MRIGKPLGNVSISGVMTHARAEAVKNISDAVVGPPEILYKNPIGSKTILERV
tara:strand:- start:1108 stop:1266 length:159 start_codon:yes stop_codon:yes gene_type:complete